MKKFENGYTIDWTRNTVIITKDFATKARELGSQECKLMMEFRKMKLDVEIRQIATKRPTKTDKKPFGHPTYKQMEIHINNMDDAEIRFPQFEKAKEEAKAHDNAYQYVLNWFKSVYPTFNEVPTFTNGTVIVNDPNEEEAAA